MNITLLKLLRQKAFRDVKIRKVPSNFDPRYMIAYSQTPERLSDLPDKLRPSNIYQVACKPQTCVYLRCVRSYVDQYCVHRYALDDIYMQSLSEALQELYAARRVYIMEIVDAALVERTNERLSKY